MGTYSDALVTDAGADRPAPIIMGDYGNYAGGPSNAYPVQ